VKRFLAAAIAACALVSIHARAATAEEEGRAVFEKYITAQNAHDLKALRGLLSDSPPIILMARGKPVWGRDAALKSFEERYKGTWHIEPDLKELRVMSISRRVVQVFAPTQLTVGDPGAVPATNRTYVNLVMVKKPEGWEITGIVPVIVTPQ